MQEGKSQDVKTAGNERPDGDRPEGKECLYDFRHPNALSEGQQMILQTIHEAYAKIVCAYFSSILKSMIQIQLTSVDQLLYAEYVSSISDPGCLWKIRIQDGKKFGLLDINAELILTIIDRVLGGTGEVFSGRKKLSSIEKNVAGKIIGKCLALYNDAWKKTGELHAGIGAFESKPRYLQIAQDEDIVILILLEVTISENKFPINICLPFNIVESIITGHEPEGKKKTAGKKRMMEEQWKIEYALKAGKVDFKVMLGEANVTVQELINLEVNDVLILNHKTDDLCLAHVGGQDRYLGSVGVSGHKLAYKVVELLGDGSKNLISS